MQPLAIYGSKTNTNLSRSISLSIIDQYGIEIPLQNVTSIYHLNQSTFHFQSLNITSDLPISIHFEIEPLNVNLSIADLQ